MTSQQAPQFVVLAILDGWGIGKEGPGNAIKIANTPNFDRYWISYPHTQLEASGESVGLPRGEDGNTETGHLNLGSGRIIYQDLQRINMSIADGTFFQNDVLIKAFEHTFKFKSSVHFMGLIGAGGVHSNIEHLFALIQFAKKLKVKNVYLHLFTDGRDSPPTSGKTYIDQVEKIIKRENIGEIATVMGRYWAMDRDQRWDRTQKAYLALTKGSGFEASSAREVIENSYAKGETDEFVQPSVIIKDGKPVSVISDNDAVVFFNFRIDRPRQLTKAFVYENFSEAGITFQYDPFEIRYSKKHESEKDEVTITEPFKRGNALKNLYFVTMTEYGKPITEQGAHPAFPPEVVDLPLGAIISANNYKQLRLTESEKERFVTFYFNGLRDKPFALEDRIIIPSPKVPTYDQKPGMSSDEITDKLIQKISLDSYKLIIVNYPNADMVGHTGNIGPTVKAVEHLDVHIGTIANYILQRDGTLLITADHGNAEEMISPKTGDIDTEHSTNPVPFIAIDKRYMGTPQILQSGILADVAPTILSLLRLTIPSSMTGRNLLADVKTPKY